MQLVDKKQNSGLETLQDQLERQYGPAIAQDIIDRLEKERALPEPAKAAVPSYMDVKAMSEMSERLRAEAMINVWRLREWRRQNDISSHKNLVDLQGAALKRQCEESFKLYREAHKTYFEMFRAAMDEATGKSSAPFILSRYCA